MKHLSLIFGLLFFLVGCLLLCLNQLGGPPDEIFESGSLGELLFYFSASGYAWPCIVLGVVLTGIHALKK